jgi:hypothetical protein
MSVNEYFVSYEEAQAMLRLGTINDNLTRIVNSVNYKLQELTGYCEPDSDKIEFCSGGGLYIQPTYFPLTEITEVYDNVYKEVLLTTDYSLINDRIYCEYGRFGNGVDRYKITYVAGTSTPPAGIKSIALKMIANEYAIGEVDQTPQTTQSEIDDELSSYIRI